MAGSGEWKLCSTFLFYHPNRNVSFNKSQNSWSTGFAFYTNVTSPKGKFLKIQNASIKYTIFFFSVCLTCLITLILLLRIRATDFAATFCMYPKSSKRDSSSGLHFYLYCQQAICRATCLDSITVMGTEAWMVLQKRRTLVKCRDFINLNVY